MSKMNVTHEDFTSNKDFSINKETLNEILRNRDILKSTNKVEVALKCVGTSAPELFEYDKKDGSKGSTMVYRAEFSNESLGTVQISITEALYNELVLNEWYLCKTKLITSGDHNRLSIDKFKNADFSKLEFF
jgi:hypothetical protein